MLAEVPQGAEASEIRRRSLAERPSAGFSPTKRLSWECAGRGSP